MAYAHNYASTPKYRELKFLGKGGFGTVYEVKSTSDGAKYALKLIPIPTSIYERNLINRETSILISLSHSNVVNCYSHTILENKHNQYFNIPSSLSNPYNYKVLSLRLELCECDVASKLMIRSYISDTWNQNIFKQVVLGVEYLHSRDIIHRDLKPANILLKGETAKLTDFGLAKGGVFSWNANHSSGLGTPLYMAPEVKNGRYDKTVDIYSLGMILLEFYTDNRVFHQWVQTLSVITYNTPMPRIDEKGIKFIDLITKMTKEPSNRPSLSSIKRHF